MLGQRPCRSGSPQGVRGTVHFVEEAGPAVAPTLPGTDPCAPADTMDRETMPIVPRTTAIDANRFVTSTPCGLSNPRRAQAERSFSDYERAVSYYMLPEMSNCR